MLRRWWKRFRYVVRLGDNPYLVRYRLWKSSRCGIYLHHILRGDVDRELHDHPFDWTSVVLWGGYWEERFCEDVPGSGRMMRYRGLFSVTRRKATWAHRVDQVKPGTWTLFIRGPRLRDWGFYDDIGRWTRAVDDNQQPVEKESECPKNVS